MGNSSRGLELEALLANAGWMRRLARHLVGEDADEVVQETWAAASQRPPEPGRPARPWLAEVLRNVVRMRARVEGRRRARELAVAAALVAPATPERLVERMELQRLVAELVMTMEEPYRSTLLLRFYEELPASEIARQQGVPAGTVRWRTREAIERLRARLDERQRGDRRAWMVVVARLAGRGAPRTGVLVMTLKSKVGGAGLVALALLLAGGWWWRGRAPEPAAPEQGLAARDPPRWSPASPDGEPPAAGRPRIVALAPATGGFEVKGRVTDSGAGPVVGARVTATMGPAAGDPAGALRVLSTTTDAQGAYALSLDGGVYSLAAAADGYPRKGHFLSLTGDTKVDFRLDPGTSLSGRVVGRGGTPVPGAVVRALPVETTGYRRSSVASDGEGWFRLDGVAPGEWRIEARQGTQVGTTGVLRVLPTLSMPDVEVVVERAFSISGRVVGRDGEGLAGIGLTVEPRGATGGASTRTDARGAFRSEGLVPGAYELTASTWQPGAPRAYAEATIAKGDVTGIVLAIPAPATVEGVVVDGATRPVAKAKVYAIMGQGPGPRDLSRGAVATTDAGGRFSLPGLDPGGLSVRAERDPSTIATWGPEPIRPGEVKQLTLHLTSGAGLTGMVLYPGGAPAAAAVSVQSPEGRRGRLSQGVVGPDGRYQIRGISPAGRRWPPIAGHPRGPRSGAASSCAPARTWSSISSSPTPRGSLEWRTSPTAAPPAAPWSSPAATGTSHPSPTPCAPPSTPTAPSSSRISTPAPCIFCGPTSPGSAPR